MIKFLFLTSLLSLSTSRVVRAEGYAEEEELPMMGPMVTVWNSFQDSVITGGAEVVFDVSTSAVMEGVEFFGFPTGGFYDIDVTNHPGSIVWTLKNNSAASAEVPQPPKCISVNIKKFSGILLVDCGLLAVALQSTATPCLS